MNCLFSLFWDRGDIGPRECFVHANIEVFMAYVFRVKNRDCIQLPSGFGGLFLSISWIDAAAVSGENGLGVGHYLQTCALSTRRDSL